MNDQWDPDRWQQYALRFAQKFGRHQQRWAREAGATLRGGRMVADGDLRLIVLVLLEDGPRHGYDIIKALEEKSGGIYTPSPGVIYPTLTYLEEAGYTTAASDGNKRVYSITDTGRTYLQENREAADAVLKRMEWVGERVKKAREWAEQGGRGRGGWGQGGRGRGGWGGPGGREEREAATPAAAALDKARRRLRMLIVDTMEGSEEEQTRLADIINRAADEALGKH